MRTITCVGICARGQGFEYGVDAVTPAGWEFSDKARKNWTHSYAVPQSVIDNPAFQQWAQSVFSQGLSLVQIKATVRGFMRERAS